MLDVLAFKATDVPAKNLVTNGNFSNGTAGYSSFGATISAADNILSVTGTGAFLSAQTWFNNPEYVSGDMFYARVRVRVTNNIASQVRLVSYPSQSLSRTIATPAENEWIDISAQGTYSYSGSISDTRLMVITTYPTAGDAAGKVTEVQYVLLLNLTQIFGAGNEPTREQMDELLAQFPNSWFNGVGNLFNAKHFMTMYFKKITELETAIAALGGS